MSDFSAATAIIPDGDHFVADIPPGWSQGRGAYGGVVFGLLTRALQAAEGDRPLRALTGEIPAPVQPGPTRVTIEVLRRGKGLTTLEARLLQEGEVRARATGLLGRPRAEGVKMPVPRAPELPPAAEVEPLFFEPPLGPEFAQHLEIRAVPPLPFSGSDEAVVAGWVDFRAFSGDRYRVAELVGLVDVFWPAIYAQQTAPSPGATISFMAEPILAEVPAGPLAFRSRAVSGRDGYVTELRELWTEDGRLVLLNQQCICLIR